MKHKFTSMLLSGVLAGAMLMSTPVAQLKTAAESKAPYISEVFIAYGKTEDEAKQWLIDNGWEPVKGDFNRGKGREVASVMGIKRTADPNDAITDMAVMNMKNEGYSFDDYESIVKEKKAEINEFIYSFVPVLEEYRANYRGEGSEGGQKRARYAHDLLNKFYDGDIDGNYAVHDTGKPLGDLLLEKTRLEYGESKYDALPKNEQIKYADLQQIILESSTTAVTTIERTLAMASDAGEDTWLDRLEELSGEKLVENIGKYVPDAAGKDLSASVAKTYLNAHFGDAAAELSKEYFDIQSRLMWYITYNDTHDLWQHEDESDVDHSSRVDAYFEELKVSNEEMYDSDINKYATYGMLCETMYDVSYKGDWGETLGDFFYPQDGGTYNTTDAFLPIAAALSPGQRAGIRFLSLEILLNSALDSDSMMSAQFSEVDEICNGMEQISVYSGINRAIFRKGVALTSDALMQKNMGNDPYNIWDPEGGLSIFSTCAIIVGLAMVIGGLAASMKYYTALSAFNRVSAQVRSTEEALKAAKDARNLVQVITQRNKLSLANDLLKNTPNPKGTKIEQVATKGQIIACIGAALMVAFAVVKIIELTQYNNRTFTMIPMMIVDEADIVTYLTDAEGNPILDEKGNQKKDIHFDQFAYYQVVKCNRQAIGINPKAQYGVSDYKSWGCGDAADLNADVGQQWVALYTIKNPSKGNPILADSLKLQYGDSTVPEGCTSLHYFHYTFAADLAEIAYAFENKTNGIYFFWKSDANAFTASTFSKGYIALAAVGGLAAGILGTTVVLVPKRKKNIPEAPAAA